MRILVLNQAYHPDVIATAQHAHDAALHFARAGHEVHVIASRSLYNGRGATLPAGELIDGIQVHRVGLSLFGKTTFFLRGVDSGIFLMLACMKALALPRPDVTLALCNPPFVAIIARVLRALKGVPYVYWLMDLYPDLPVACDAMRADSLATRALDRVNVLLIRGAARSVALGRCMIDRVAAKGVARQGLALITPWANSREIVPMRRDGNPYRAEWGLGDRFVVMYSGNFGLGHDLATLCRAALLLRDRPDIAFVFAGGGKRKGEVETFAREHPEAPIQVHPHQPRERLAASLSVADAHLISLEDAALGVMVPSKLFGIMAAARPAIFVGPAACEVARIIQETGCGLVLPSGRPEALAAAVKVLADDRPAAEARGRRGREALEAVYDQALACQRLEALLREAAASSAGA